MLTRIYEHTQSTFTYRQALRQAMSSYLTAPFFRRWLNWIGNRAARDLRDGRSKTCFSWLC